VPFLNEERWLPACLEALDAQTLDRSLFELIFVDNGSTDRSMEIVTAHGGVQLLHEPQRDPYLARNRGIAAACARHIVFLDADCFPAPDWLAELRAEVALSPAAIVLGYVAHPANASIFSRCYEEYHDAKLVHLISSRLTRHYFGHAGNMVVRSDLFRELGLFHAMPIAGDTEIIHRSLARRPDTELRYARRARVVHAEMRGIGDCMSKWYDTGRHANGASQQSRFRLLPLVERWRALRLWLTARRPRAGRITAMFFSCAIGFVSFEAGRMVHRLRRSAVVGSRRPLPSSTSQG
jgi:glycosyltransferase involved in cell wall biosynthesis